MTSQSEQFEREAEETRWQLAGTLEELRASGESLEDAFVRIVGAEHTMERLDWL